MNNFIIAFTGKAGAGKDTLATFIKKHLSNHINEYNMVNLNFADPIKHGIQSMFGVTPDELEFMKRNNQPLLAHNPKTTPRELMINIGTEYGRKVLGDDIWVDLYKRKVLTYYKNKFIFTTDVRFKNEYDFIKSIENSIVIKVVRDGIEKINHESEKNDIPYDVLVYNSTKDELDKVAKKLADEVYESYIESKY